jgi:hypothetical protein
VETCVAVVDGLGIVPSTLSTIVKKRKNTKSVMQNAAGSVVEGKA